MGLYLDLLSRNQRIAPELDLSEVHRINQGTVDRDWDERRRREFQE